MHGLRVLITNQAISHRSGTETYVRDLALALLRHGHRPAVYAPCLGEMADEIAVAGIPVVDDLNHLRERPDVIHGNHHFETLTALLHFSDTPALYFCHDRMAWHDQVLLFPRVRRWVAVDDTCAERFLEEPGVPTTDIRVLLHAVDLARFRPRPPLSPRPRRALVFSHTANEYTHLRGVREACRRAGLECDVLGAGAGNDCRQPHEVLGDYDLVFAKARCAQEALAVGCAVILCDRGGAGSLVTTTNLEGLRRRNFGRAVLRQPVVADVLLPEIERYDAADGDAVAERFRATADLEQYVGQIVALYREAIADHQRLGVVDYPAELRAAAAYMRRVAPKKQLDAAHLRELQADNLRLNAENQRHAAELELAGLREECGCLREELDALTAMQSPPSDAGLQASSNEIAQLAQQFSGDCLETPAFVAGQELLPQADAADVGGITRSSLLLQPLGLSHDDAAVRPEPT